MSLFTRPLQKLAFCCVGSGTWLSATLVALEPGTSSACSQKVMTLATLLAKLKLTQAAKHFHEGVGHLPPCEADRVVYVRQQLVGVLLRAWQFVCTGILVYLGCSAFEPNASIVNVPSGMSVHSLICFPHQHIDACPIHSIALQDPDRSALWLILTYFHLKEVEQT